MKMGEGLACGEKLRSLGLLSPEEAEGGASQCPTTSLTQQPQTLEMYKAPGTSKQPHLSLLTWYIDTV